MDIKHVKFVVKHNATKKIYACESLSHANQKAAECDRLYTIANRCTRSKATIMSIQSYIKFCEAEGLSCDEAFRFDT